MVKSVLSRDDAELKFVKNLTNFPVDVASKFLCGFCGSANKVVTHTNLR